MPGGMYRNQFWLPYPPGSDVLLCLGIHGQMIYVNPLAGLSRQTSTEWPQSGFVSYSGGGDSD